MFQDRHPLLVPAGLDGRPRPGDEVLVAFACEQAAFHHHRDLADGGVLERSEGDALDIRHEEGLSHEVADADEFGGVARPRLQARPVCVVDLAEDLHHVQEEHRWLAAVERDNEDGLRCP